MMRGKDYHQVDDEHGLIDDYMRYMQSREKDKRQKASLRRSLDQQLIEKELIAKQSHLYLHPSKLGGDFALSNRIIKGIHSPYLNKLLYSEGQSQPDHTDLKCIEREQKLLREEYQRLSNLVNNGKR